MALERKGKLASVRQIRYGTFPSPPPSEKKKRNKAKRNKFVLDRWMDGQKNIISR